MKKLISTLFALLIIVGAHTTWAGETRYFQCTPEQSKGFYFTVMPEGDVLPLDIMPNAKAIYVDEQMAILHVLIGDATIRAIAEITGLDDPLSTEAVQALGISRLYIGRTRADVFAKYPELGGLRQSGTDEDGGPIYVDIMLRHSWGGTPDSEVGQ